MCLGTLAILDRLDLVEVPTLAWWLAERQLPNGGLNGRPEKLEDVIPIPWCATSILIHFHLGVLQFLGPVFPSSIE